MSVFDLMAEMGHEQVVLCNDPAAGYRGIIAIHNTVLGPAVGGTRFWHYASDDEAVVDALRLSRAMTYKAAAAGLEMGGGKAVIIRDGGTPDRQTIFRAHGRFIDKLAGRYFTGEDVGTTIEDLDYINRETKYVISLPSGAGDPAPWTGLGIFRGIQASARYRWGSDDLTGRTVAIQGCGHVGYSLAKELHGAGARLIVADIDPTRAKQLAGEFEATPVEAEAIYGVQAEIFAPCALGGIVNDHTIPQLKVEIVAGGANNQLLEDRHGDALKDRGILYAPDYVMNAGGLISAGIDLFGWDQKQTRDRVLGIYDTLLTIFDAARAEGIPTSRAADRLAERRIQARKAQAVA
ncbi:MAG TPA: Glu/Leu/Phe/Val dehydrogenase [Blastocatellia bacterium]|nr:Glu/Leu/Phe/Val dehydrogenase [Blastocatellia bacterium]